MDDKENEVNNQKENENKNNLDDKKNDNNKDSSGEHYQDEFKDHKKDLNHSNKSKDKATNEQFKQYTNEQKDKNNQNQTKTKNKEEEKKEPKKNYEEDNMKMEQYDIVNQYDKEEQEKEKNIPQQTIETNKINVNIKNINATEPPNFVDNPNIEQYPSPFVSIKDLQENSKQRLLINSPLSLKSLNDTGYTLNELYYKSYKEFVDEHKELIPLNEEEKLNRYNLFEKLRLGKIDYLVEYRDKLKDKEILLREDNNNNCIDNEGYKGMKDVILDNDKRKIKEELDTKAKQNEKELANIIEIELNNDLFNQKMLKQEDEYNKKFDGLNFMSYLNLNDVSGDFKTKNNIRFNTTTSSIIRYKTRAFSSRRQYYDLFDEKANYFENLNLLYNARINQRYEMKQKRNKYKLEILEKKKRIKNEQNALKKRISVERAYQNLQKNIKNFENKHNLLVQEIENKKLQIYQNKKKFESCLQEKKENNYIKRLLKFDKIQAMRRMDENMRQIYYQNLLEKYIKQQAIKFDRMNIQDMKLSNKFYLDDDRKKNIMKVRSIINKGITPENLNKILEAFPYNKEIKKVIDKYNKNLNELMLGETGTRAKKRPKTSTKFSYSNSRNKFRLYTNPNKDKKKNNMDSRILNEGEIRERVNLYRKNMYKDFFNSIEEEKQKEQLREKELKKLNNQKKQNELEYMYAKERALTDLKLKVENRKIQEKVINYEKYLRKNNINAFNNLITQ